MKVGFNARILHAGTLRGWSRYTVNLLAELSGLDVELVLYSDLPLHDAHLGRLRPGGFQVRVSPRMRYIEWEQRWLSAQVGADGLDVLHTPFNFGLPWSTPCPRVLTLHDAIGQFGRTWRERIEPEALKMGLHHWISRTRADRIITVSQHSKHDLVEKLGLASDRIDVIYEAADARFHDDVGDAARQRVRAHHELRKPYVLYVGGWEERKNVPFLLRAYADAKLADVDLVLAGGLDAQRTHLSVLAGELDVAEGVKLLGWVDDADLPALYAEAMCFVYPSTYEGFGLQLCESMAVGCPTLAARATCLPEVLAAGGDTFSLRDTGELTELLRKVHHTPAYRAELQERAQRRAATFSWGRTAEETLATYQMAVRGHRR